MKFHYLLLAIVVASSIDSNAQKTESEKLADQFWSWIKADSSAFSIYHRMGHASLDQLNFSNKVLSAALEAGKPVSIERKGYREAIATNGIAGKGYYSSIIYRNQYADPMLGEKILFEKLLFYRSSKKENFKLLAYDWSYRGTDLDIDKH